MKYSTERRKRSRLQGHRRRRRTFTIPKPVETVKLSWTEYKTLRQYQSMGDVLDEFKTYGFRGGMDNIIRHRDTSSVKRSHSWLTEDPDH